MSDCSPNAWRHGKWAGIEWRTVDAPGGARRSEPPQAELRRLGGPPWELAMEWPGCLPPEARAHVGVVNVGGVRFVRVRERDWDDVDAAD